MKNISDFIDHFVNAICICDENKSVVFFNQKYANQWGFHREELEQNPSWEYCKRCIALHCDADVQNALIEKIQNDRTRLFYDEITHIDGTILKRYSTPVNDQNGIYCGRLWEFVDITECSQIKQDLLSLKEELEEKNSLIRALSDELSAIDSHEDHLCNKSINKTLACIGNKWSILIVHNLLTEVKRFGELRKKLNISPKILTQRLRILEEKGFVHREVYAEVPPRVEYSLTELGHELKVIYDAMWRWSDENKEIAEYVWEIGENILIVHSLLTGAKRFGDFRKVLNISPRALKNHLHILEERGFVHREVYAEVPPRVEYSLTELGYSLKPIHDAMWYWSEEYMRK